MSDVVWSMLNISKYFGQRTQFEPWRFASNQEHFSDLGWDYRRRCPSRWSCLGTERMKSVQIFCTHYCMLRVRLRVDNCNEKPFDPDLRPRLDSASAQQLHCMLPLICFRERSRYLWWSVTVVTINAGIALSALLRPHTERSVRAGDEISHRDIVALSLTAQPAN